jgi:hypothetical protein
MAKKKKNQPKPEDQEPQVEQSEGDVFDEDDDQDNPPVLAPDDPDAAEKPQDAPGQPVVPWDDQEDLLAAERARTDPENLSQPAIRGDKSTLVKEQPSITGEAPALDPNRVLPESEVRANQELLAKKGDLSRQQPVYDPAAGVIQGLTLNGQPISMGHPVFQKFLAAMSAGANQEGAARAAFPMEASNTEVTETTAFQVVRGKVGAYPEGSVVPKMSFLGIKDVADVKVLIEKGVLIPLSSPIQK